MSVEENRPGSVAATEARQHLHDIHIRPIRSEDWHRLQLFHSRLSETTVHRRFFGAKRELSEPLAHRFTQLDGCNDVALVATTGTRGRIVGVGRYNRLSPTEAEVAFVVEDAYQHYGIGSRLMWRLRETALRNGINRFLAEVLPGNQAMVRLLEKAGKAEVRIVQGILEVKVDLLSIE